MRSGQRRAVLAALVAATGLAAMTWWRASQPSAENLARGVRDALDRGQRADALQFAEQAIRRFPRSAAIRMAAADVELDGGRLEAALSHLQAAEDDGGIRSLDAVGAAGDVLFQLNRLSEAETCFRRVLEAHPQNVVGRQRLALVLALSGRRMAAREVLFAIIRGNQFDTRDLALFGEPEKVFDNPDFVKRYDDPSPADPGSLLGRARFALYKNRSTEAVRLFQDLLTRLPADIDALAGYGRALLESGADDEFLKWHSTLPVAADENPEIWFVRGRFAQLRSENDVALRCYGEAVRCDPNQISAISQMSTLLHQQGNEAAARAFQLRARRLRELKETLDVTLADSTRLEGLLAAAELTESLGRIWEARGWLLAAAALTARRDLRDRAEKLAGALDDQVPQTLPGANPAAELDLSVFPLPAWDGGTRKGRNATASANVGASRVTFADMAMQAGLNFTYFNGRGRDSGGMRIFESNGGGVAAVDYDGDLWPDLYFTQATEWPPQPEQTRHLDRLFRNLGNGRFADVTGVSGLGDERYSQGVTAGDLDNDGFPDLYVANIGENRLYRNNGDGTFTDQTKMAGLEGGGWTTSVLIADVNGDGNPDIYDVTYLAGSLPFEHVCHDKQNQEVVRVCSPAVFPADFDRLFLGRGDGSFENVSSEARIAVPDGKGLGITAFDIDSSGRLSLYIANDMMPNFLFLNQTPRPGDRPVFEESARTAGCAVNADGHAPASMGIAIDDSDRDGLLDLFVTTFHNEYYVLFRQQPGGLFVDVSSQAGLREPTVPMLGFGTQFLDADLDGWPDLVMANGHVDDFRDSGIPYRMRGQYFANRGNGQFLELSPAQLGDYFRSEQLGRGMARLDWNRDGHEDFAVSNLDTPASLVTNQTRDAGHFLSLQLRGVASSRDAIGTTVVVRVADRRLVKQLTAGDGFQACNQRQLVFGLAESEVVDEIEIRWPAGLRQKFAGLPADSEYIVVEGRPEPERMPTAPRW